MAISNYQAEKQNEPWNAGNDFHSLYKVFGLGAKSNYSISFSKENGLIAWIAGPYVILYDISIDKQVSFIKNPNNKILSCVCFGDRGTLLATGEGNCKNGEIRLYEVYYDKKNKEVNFNSILNYKCHKYGIDKILFFRNDSYILSIGSNEDKAMNIMDLNNKQNIFFSKFNRPILAADVCDDFMILCGIGFIKMYNYKKYIENYSEEEAKEKNSLPKYLVELSKLKDKSFISVVIDKNNKYNDNSPEEKKIFFMTYDCYLVEMKSTNHILNRWVHLKSSKGISLTMWNNLLGCGCGDGVYRIFTNELKYITSLKNPPPLGKINTEKEINISDKNSIYADIIASLYDSVHKKLIVIYSDKTFIAWDISNNNPQIYKSKIFHCGGIKAMDYFTDIENNIIKIATCSDDKTVIFWNIPIDEFVPNPNNNKKNNHIFYSNYIRHIFFFGNNFDAFKINQQEFLSNSYNLSNHKKANNENDNEEDDDYNLTAIRFSPCGNYISIGDTFGNIQIYNLIDFEQVNKIDAHNGEINSLDMINFQDNQKLYLSSGSSDNLVSLIDMSEGLSTNPKSDDKTIMEKMSSPVISVVFCIDKNRQLKLIVGEQNSTITFFQIINGILQTLQKNYDDKLKTYCLSYSPAIKKIISGHNGKISIWKTSTNIAHKHFQVNKGDKILENFRIASDSSGLMFATSNDDKMIRVRALHDGKLLSKIQVSESISSLFFVLDDNYLIATSIEGYLFFFKLNQNLIKQLKKDNELINSTEERNIINNKLKLLQKFMENDTSLSKNSQVKNLLDKFQQSEEATIEDLKILDGFVKEGKKNHKDISDQSKKPKEIIELKEEKPNNNDDQENENINENNKNNNKFEFLNRSNIFERGLKDRASTDSSLYKKNIGRISLTDNYNQKQSKNFNKNPFNISKDNNKNIINNDIDKDIDKDIGNNKIEDNNNLVEKKFSNINIEEEYSNNNNNNNNINDNDNNNNSPVLNNDIKEEIDEGQSHYNAKIINNSQTELSGTHINNLIITQTSYAVKSNNFTKPKKILNICNENNICYTMNNNSKKQYKNLLIDNLDDIEINDNLEPKDRLIKSIDNNIVDNIVNNQDLKELEMHVEKLLSKVRCKLGNDENDPIMEKMIDKYSKLIIDSMNKKDDD